MRSAALSPAVLAGLILTIVLSGMAAYTAAHAGGAGFAYPLDDSYIHLALARTLATAGVWGIGPANFASASSSPGWTVLLATFDRLVGSHLLNGLILNLLCLIAICFTLDWGLRLLRPASSWTFRTAGILLITLAGPLTNLAFIGMEHVAQTLSILLVAILSVDLLAAPPAQPLPRGRVVALLASVAAAGALRYEAVFIVGPVLLALLLRRRVLLACAFAFAAALGPVGFGLFFFRHSGFFLPFSVIVKAAQEKPPSGNLLLRLWHLSAGGTFRPVLLAPLLAWLLGLRARGPWNRRELLLLLSSLITLQHLLLAPTRWLMRYDTYFVVLALFALWSAIPETAPRLALSRIRFAPAALQVTAALLALTLLLLSPFLVYRVVVGITRGPLAALDRMDEHVAMGRFLHTFYDGDAVVLNDIGATAFYSHAHILDILGLGSIEPVRAAHAGHPITAPEAAAWAAREHAPIAILQNDWDLATRALPPSWILLETWRAPRRVAVGPIQIGFYATSPAAIPRLCHALATFPRPSDDQVIQRSDLCPTTGQP